MKALLISDFSINNLAGYLRNDLLEQKIEISIAPFNQVYQVLIDSNLECWNDQSELAIVWTQPERILSSFQSFLNNESIDLETIREEVERFASLLISVSNRVRVLYVANWTVDLSLNYQGNLATKSEIGVIDVLSKMNETLAFALRSCPNIHVLNSQKWISSVGDAAYSPKLWYLTKTPFHTTVFAQASKDIVSFIRSTFIPSKKVIVVDLDNTLWGGVVGDIGYENLLLGGHDAKGEAFNDFQSALKSFLNKGIILAIASKNEESVALKAIENHPGMVLRKNDFSAWRINWDDKAKNILEISQELNIGLDSIVFLDDNPFERERVKSVLPEVFVPELPKDPMLYKRFLLQLDCFNSTSISDEDRKRTEFYRVEKQRKDHKNGFTDLEEWLKSIGIKVTCEELTSDNLQRVLQLLNKTNQMNLLTNRYVEKDLLERMSNQNQWTFAFSVKDNFGDAGLTGVLGLKMENETLVITDFVLSCRVIGRKIEETMLSVAVKFAKDNKFQHVEAKYVITDKNKPCFDFFLNSGFENQQNSFTWNAEKMYVRPYYVELNEY